MSFHYLIYNLRSVLLNETIHLCDLELPTFYKLCSEQAPFSIYHQKFSTTILIDTIKIVPYPYK